MYRYRGEAASGRADVPAELGPLVRMQLTFSRALWRIGPAWSVLAGALAAGWAPDNASAILRLGAAVVLGDLAWGSLRRTPRSGPAVPHALTPPILPYAGPDSPLARFLGHLAGDTGLPVAAVWQPLAISLVLVVALSLLLGPAALALSAGVLLLVALAWSLMLNLGSYPALSMALLDVAAPWLLGMSLVGLEVLASRASLGSLALMAGFTLLQWGAYRASRSGAIPAPGVWLGQAAVLLALVAVGQAGACAVAAALFAPPSWWLLRRDSNGLARALPWWWLVLVVAALARAQIFHTL